MCAPTSFRLKIRDAMHDDMVKEQGLVVDFYVARKKTSKVMHIPIHTHGITEGKRLHKKQQQLNIFSHFKCFIHATFMLYCILEPLNPLSSYSS